MFYTLITICITTKHRNICSNALNLIRYCSAMSCIGIKGNMKASPQNSFTAFSQYIKRVELRGKELLFSPLSLCWKSEDQRNAREMELEPWMSSHSLKDSINLGLYLCIGRAVAVLCPLDARQKHQNILVPIGSILPDLNTRIHIKSQSLDADLIPSFTDVCRNQDLAAYDFKNIFTWHMTLAVTN